MVAAMARVIVSTRFNHEIGHCFGCNSWWLIPEEIDGMIDHENAAPHGEGGAFCHVTWYVTPFIFPPKGMTLDEMERLESEGWRW